MEKIVISLGGSLVYPGKLDTEYIKSFANLIKKLKKDYKIVIVVGGGKIAREYINEGRLFAEDEIELDKMGILSTKLNASFLSLVINKRIQEINNLEEIWERLEHQNIVITGGFFPGMKTDDDAAIIADYINANRLINLTNVDGIYTKFPIDKDSKLIERMSYDELIEMSSKLKAIAGMHFPFTTFGAQICKRSRIPILIVNGKNLKNVEKAIKGKKFKGTYIGD